MVVENNSVGFAVLEKLKDMGYPNIYYSIKSTHEYIDQLTAEHTSNSVAGFYHLFKNKTNHCCKNGRIYKEQANYNVFV
jgi:hypothetical protein